MQNFFKRIFRLRFKVFQGCVVLTTCTPLTIYAAATLTINVTDGANEGYNSNAAPDPVSAAAGNHGATLGEQRVIALQNALDWWGQRLDSAVTIVVDAQMSAQTCSASSAVLASAGATQIFRDFTGAIPGTWYHAALANKIFGADLSASGDIGTTANSDIDNNDSCLFGTNWYYALGAPPSNTISFFNVMLHELGHGLGVSSFTSTTTGDFIAGFPGIYETFLEDHDTSPNSWLDMTAAQRLASMTDNGNLHWTGPNVINQLGVLNAGASDGHVRNYAPTTFRPGSSVSHWDTELNSVITNSAGQRYEELMEPFATGREMVLLTDEMLQDEGWNAFEGDCGDPLTTTQDNITLNSAIVTTDQDACLDIEVTGNTLVSGSSDVTFDAGREIRFGPGFSKESGSGVLRVEVNPLKTLRN